MWFKKLFHSFVNWYIIPKSTEKDKARKEFILNILLVGLIFLSLVGLIQVTYNALYPVPHHMGNPLLLYLVLVFFLCFLLFLSRIGRIKLSAFLLILFLFISSVLNSYTWGANLPEILLIYALIIIIGGILIHTKFALAIANIIAITNLLIAFLQINGYYHLSSSWRNQPLQLLDAVTASATLLVIALVSWLFNREMESALKRARFSEAEVKKQRNKLEELVEERTKQLKQVQVEKLTQLYRFAELGRITSGLFHDLTGPLTLIALNLDELSKNKLLQKKDLSTIEDNVKRAIVGIRTLENFLLAARQQIQNQEVKKHFFLAAAITQVIQIVRHKMNENRVTIHSTLNNSLKITGNPIRFHQLVYNLVVNAIESYDNSKKKERVIELRLERKQNEAVVFIQDWGKGIEKKQLDKIFEPLFTTKSPEKGTGIGLSLSQEIVEKGFGGKIEVISSKGRGTTFIVHLPLKAK